MRHEPDAFTAPSACTSPGADAGPLPATPAVGVQTERAVTIYGVTARATGEGYWPDAVTFSVRGGTPYTVAWPAGGIDDFDLPEAIEHVDAWRVIAAVSDAVEAYGRDHDAGRF